MRKNQHGLNSKKIIDYNIFIPSLLIVIAICIPFSMYEAESLDLSFQARRLHPQGMRRALAQ
ncbi:hypothetical protein [Aquibacillus sediminis]|uniref:hypothetical protein n=1 Tax=Aquibacillus sediminis TaxID=2574734 RepID=UPI001107C224|nr:hypothetical protein [Aquibacillus sediminis]